MPIKRKNRKTAFSLIELSIVIIIIGILVAALVSSTDLVSKAKVTAAKSTTQSSPVVNHLEDLTLWLDSSNEENFVTRKVGEILYVDTWKDINPALSAKNPAQSITDSQPVLSSESTAKIGGLPVVRFDNDDGTDDYLSFDGSAIMGGQSTTVFIVARRRSLDATNADLLISNPDIGFSAANDPSIYSAPGNDATISGSIPMIGIFTVVSDIDAQTVSVFQNGQLANQETSVATTTSSPIIAANSSYLGTNVDDPVNPTTFNHSRVDIGEVIVLNTALDTNDRVNIERYLSKKWSIPLR